MKRSLHLALAPADAGYFDELNAKLFGSFLKPDHSLASGNDDIAKLSRAGYYLDSMSCKLAILIFFSWLIRIRTQRT